MSVTLEMIFVSFFQSNRTVELGIQARSNVKLLQHT